MQWLAPMTAIYAAAAAVPLLVLMYFLKLKRQEQIISSTLLWKRAVQDLQVNAPFQRLRRNILLLLQLLALAAALVALGRPVVMLTAGPGKRIVLLIDRSGSMSAADVHGGRLAAAKRQGNTLIDSLRAKGAFALTEKSDQAMVIAFDEAPKVMCNFTADKAQLRAAVDAINPTDAGSSLESALKVARAYASPGGEEAANLGPEARAELHLLSDGRIRDTSELSLDPGEMIYHRIGESSDNVAVVALDARRSYGKPDQVQVFAALANYGPEPVTCDVQLSIDGNVRSVRTVSMAARREGRAGRASVAFELTCPGPGIVEVRHSRRDSLACDDAAWAILAPPKKLSALLVTRGNVAIETALKACPLAGLKIVTPEQFEAMDTAAAGAAGEHDVIVLDDCPAVRVPRGRYLVFGRPPAGLDVTAGEQLTNQIAVDWRPRHPILQFVDLADLAVAECYKLSVPRDAEVIAELSDTAGMALVQRRGGAALVVAFDAMKTNWPFKPSFVMFCYNSLEYLGAEAAAGRRRSLRVGEPIVAEALPPHTAVKLDGPGPRGLELTSDALGAVRYAGAQRAGLYTLRIEARPAMHFAVNCLDAAESDIAPAGELALLGQTLAAEAGPPRKENAELWPLAAMLALALVLLEWFVYNSKVRL